MKEEMSEQEDLLDEFDDWFIGSLKRYKDLHVFQLERPTKVLEWTSERTVCVAGCDSAKSEILELRLPSKLFVEENQGLCAERDFRVLHGGFTEGAVDCLRHVPGTRCVVTSDGLTSQLQLWELGGDDTDVIRRTGSIDGRGHTVGGRTRMAAAPPPVAEPQVVHGGRVCDVQVTHLTSGRTLYTLGSDSAEPLASLHFLTDRTFLAACCDGNIYIADTRTSEAPQHRLPQDLSGHTAHRWWTQASAGPDPSSCRVLRLSEAGVAAVSDLRSPGKVVSGAHLDLRNRHCSLDHVTLCWAPELDHCVSVSGFGGDVQIYDTSSWRTEIQEARPLFQHHGHERLSGMSSSDDDGLPAFITCHVWHPSRPRTLLSAASDGSVHVWDWVNSSSGSDGQTEAAPEQI